MCKEYIIVLDSLIICDKIENNIEKSIDQLSLEENNEDTNTTEETDKNDDSTKSELSEQSIDTKNKNLKSRAVNNSKILKNKLEYAKKKRESLTSDEDETSDESNETSSTTNQAYRIRTKTNNKNKNDLQNKCELKINNPTNIIVMAQSLN